MALWPVSAFNLLQDNAPISSEKMWPGLYILDLAFTIMDFVGWRPNNLSGHWNTLYGSRIYLIRLGFPSMILISTASANFQGFSHNEHTPDKPYGQNTLFSKRNLSFWKLHYFFWGKLYAIGPLVIHHFYSDPGAPGKMAIKWRDKSWLSFGEECTWSITDVIWIKLFHEVEWSIIQCQPNQTYVICVYHTKRNYTDEK